MNDAHLAFPGARLSWKLIEETDSFVLVGSNKSTGQRGLGTETSPRAFLKSYTMIPITVTIGHQVPKALALSGETAVNLPADDSLLAAVVNFKAPRTQEPRHYTLYLTLTAADGRVLSENWDHFVVVPSVRKFRPAEGITPAPRFNLELHLSQAGGPLAEAEVAIADLYNSERRTAARLDREGRASLPALLPGAYRLEVSGREL